MALFSRLLAAREGSVLVMGALSLTGVIGMSALAVDTGQGYMTKVRNQRVADMAALAAAVAYNGSSSLDAAQATARDVVAASGLAASTATVTPDSTSAPTNISVTVTTPVQVALGRVLTATPSFNVTNMAKASLVGNTSAGCIVALSSAVTNGVSLAGGTSITASGCAVTTNSGVSVPAGTHLTAKQVNAGKAVSDQGAQWNQPGITTTPSGNNIRQNLGSSGTDTVAGDARVVAGFSRIGTFTRPDANSDPSTPTTGLDWNFPNNADAFSKLASSDPVKANCTQGIVNNKMTYSCRGGAYTIKTFKPNESAVNFSGTVNITISGGLANTSGRINFYGGSVSVNGGLSTGSGGIDFGNATLAVGSGDLTVTSGGLTLGNGDVTVNGTLTLGGGGAMTLGSGRHSFNAISAGGGARLTMGSGSLNVNGPLNDSGGGTSITVGAGPVTIGRDAAGSSVTVAGGSSLSFDDGAFSANGSVATSGGSSLTFGDTASHYINGALNLNGSATFGAGAYYVNGAFTNNTGGSMTGSGVSFFLAGTFTLSGGTSMTMSAPTSDAGGGVADLLVATKSSADTRIGGGSQNVYAGLVYAPNSALVMDGGAGVTGGGRCFMLVVSTLSMNGGTTTGTACAGIGGSGATGNVALLQ